MCIRDRESRSAGPHAAAHAYQLYLDLYDAQRTGEVSELAPIPDDPVERAEHLKAGLYFLDADMVGTAALSGETWLGEAVADHTHAIVTLIAHTRTVGTDQPGDNWIDGTRQINADLRAAELAVITAGYIRRLGFDAMAHTPTATDVDLVSLGVQAGLVESVRGQLRAPFLGATGFALSVVTTSMQITTDAPLARRSTFDELRATRSPQWLLGANGTRAGIGRLNGDHRPLHMGRYPMEKIKRVDEPTTLIIPEEVERVPVRAGGFPRAAHGDMGPKFQADVKVFAYKTPTAQAYVQQIGAMVAHQDGDAAAAPAPATTDPDRNADAVKALAYHLGADMVGV